MRLMIFSFLLCLINLAPLQAQPDPIEWGRLSPADLRLNKYEPDTSSPAVILCDYGRLSTEVLDGEYKVVLRRFKRIKIFSKSGYPEANIELLYNKTDKEYLADIRAQSINSTPGSDLQYQVLKEADILDREVDGSWSKKVFAIPGVTEGSVIEYSYSLISGDFFNYRTWAFQSHLPCLWSELRAELSGIYNYMVLLHNVKDSLFINEKTDGWKTIPDQMLSNTNMQIPVRVKSTFGRYVMKDILPLVEEPFLTCLQDYVMEIRFQLFSVSRPYNNQQNIIRSWEELVQRLNEDPSLGLWSKNNLQLRDQVYQIIKDKTGTEPRLKAIYDYIRSHFRWNGEYRVLARSNMDQILNQRNGNSAEINLLLCNMLRLAGLKCSLVAISTRSHGKVQKDFPILNQFNHLICVVRSDTSNYLLDAIDQFRPYNLLAIEDLNSTGLVLDGKNYNWITLQNSFLTKRNSIITLRIDSSGNVKGDMVLNETGHFALARRTNLEGLEKGKLMDYMMNFFGMDLVIDTFSISNRTEIELPLKIAISFSGKNVIKNMFHSDMIYFDAMISKDLKNNPLKQPSRRFPVDFRYPYEESTVLVVQVPKGYIFEELPKQENYVVSDESAEFQFKVFNTTKIFQVKSDIKIKKSTFSVPEYPELKLLFDLMVQKNSEQITAVRKK